MNARRSILPAFVLGAGLLTVWAVATRWRSPDEAGRGTIDEHSIVMLGDSITAGGDWSSLLADDAIVNRGFPGYTTSQLLEPAAQVAAASPRLVLVLTGTNDVRDGLSPERTAIGLAAVLDVFATSAPDTRVVVQTILPRAEKAAEIVRTNRAVVDLAAERGLEVLDLHPEFDDGSGGLRPQETTDGWHLTELGYERWAALLAPVIASAD